MTQPEELKKNEPLTWSTGRGTDVWEMFRAAIAGDVETIRRLLDKDPSLVRGAYQYLTALTFAVRENQVEAARLLLERGADPMVEIGNSGTLLENARDRGYTEMEKLLEDTLARVHGVSPRAEPVAAAIRDNNLAEVRSLLDRSPDLLDAGDRRSNRPIHWAVMTRQLDMIDELLARGADINARRSDGARPIHLFNGDYHYRGWRDVPEEGATTAGEVLAHLILRGAYLRHLDGGAHGQPGAGERAARRGPLAGQPGLRLQLVLPGLRVAPEKRRRQRSHRNRKAAAGARRRSQFAAGAHRAAGPRAVFGGV